MHGTQRVFGYSCNDIPVNIHNNLHRVQKKGATDFFAVTFTNIDGFS